MKNTGSSRTGSKSGGKAAVRSPARGGGQARLAVDLPVGTHRQLKVRAAMQGKSIRDYMIWLLAKDGISGE